MSTFAEYSQSIAMGDQEAHFDLLTLLLVKGQQSLIRIIEVSKANGFELLETRGLLRKMAEQGLIIYQVKDHANHPTVVVQAGMHADIEDYAGCWV